MRTFEGNKIISILGFCGVKIGDVDDFLKKIKLGIQPAGIQILNAECVASKLHLYFAFLNAQKSFEEKLAICENLEMETLLYATGYRQISKAIAMLGVKFNTSKIAVIIFGSDEREVEKAESKLVNLIDGDRDDSILEVYNGKVNVLKKVFDVSDLELETMKGDGIRLEDILTWLIVERGALLSTEH